MEGIRTADPLSQEWPLYHLRRNLKERFLKNERVGWNGEERVFEREIRNALCAIALFTV